MAHGRHQKGFDGVTFPISFFGIANEEATHMMKILRYIPLSAVPPLK